MSRTRLRVEKVNAALSDFDAKLTRIADRLRSTADGLRSGAIHPAHAANRLLKIAAEIHAPARKKEAANAKP